MNEPTWSSWHEQANERTTARLAKQQEEQEALMRIRKRQEARDKHLRMLDAVVDVMLFGSIIAFVAALCFAIM